MARAAGALLETSPVDMDAVCHEIGLHRVKPTVFGRYYEIVLALKRGQHSEALSLCRELSDEARRAPDFRIVPFDDPSIAGEADRYLRWLSPKGTSTPRIEAPDPRRWAGFKADAEAALDLVERSDPVLGAELRSLIVEIVGVSRHRDSPEPFGGASTFMLWGTVFLNVDAFPTRVAVAAGLVHEGAHQLLFGLSCREPLVNNALSERRASPLRRDPRPVIGIYHATFVCARMCYAFEAMLRPGLGLTDPERLYVERGLGEVRACFAEGRATLAAFGDLTGLGRGLLDEAAAAVDGA